MAIINYWAGPATSSAVLSIPAANERSHSDRNQKASIWRFELVCCSGVMVMVVLVWRSEEEKKSQR